MKYLVHLSRIIVGNLFIFSGLVKANDSLGFSYKLEDYFVAFGMNWDWLHQILVPMAAALCIVEIVVGVAVLVGWRMKEVSWSLLLMIIFFTILTGASAIFEIVRSCGCFGDAIPLTPWESFYKDLILIVFILIIFLKKNMIKPAEDKKEVISYFVISSIIMIPLSIQLEWNAPLIFTVAILAIALLVYFIKTKKAAGLAVIASLLVSIWFSYYAVEHLPFRDFRPYAIGKNLPEQMTLPEGAKSPVYENILAYKNTVSGEVKEFTTAEYTASKIWEDKSWEWLSTDSELIEAGDEAKITDLSILTHQDEDITDLVLSEDKVLWIVCYDLALASTEHMNQLNQLVKEAKAEGVKVYGLSSAGTAQKDKFIQDNNLDFDFLVTDGIVLKTMVRSNPGIMYLEHGTVKGKSHENDISSLNELRNN
ncbi:MAG: redoxin domain-containing protein [Flavobacteriales bacterium]|nr:redoxin domain-containing protein [Flavobacteriales bacterium]